ncbi:MAG TPA: lysophospholipid acyltransferase family protein [Gemmatimonadales bacterium]|nr:lysophospholipid acyltransferase family protein [Gemmatimonadales bacterium]
MNVPVAASRWLGVPVVGTLAATWRWRVEGEEHERAARGSGRGVIYVIWHETLLPLTWHHRTRGDITMLVSPGRDGDHLATFAGALGYGAVRGATGQDGLRALREVVETLRAGRHVAIAPDGPVGPRRVATAGAVVAAERSGALLLPLWAGADRAWRAGSWDRFLIPKPFARVAVRYGPALAVPAGSDVDEAVARMRAALDRLISEEDA